jgi:hypothetical protein
MADGQPHGQFSQKRSTYRWRARMSRTSSIAV